MKSLRVYFVSHGNGRLTGTLMRRTESWFEEPPPSAYGTSEDEVLAQLHVAVIAIEAKGPSELDRYLWEERFEVRSVAVRVHPFSAVKETGVIGMRTIPLRVYFAWTKLDSGALLVMLPRYGWKFILEDLSIAAEVIRQTIAASMAGEAPKWIYDYRTDGEEYVRAWSPGPMTPIERTAADDEYVPEVLSEIAEELVRSAAHKKLPLRVGVDPVLAERRALFDRDVLPSVLLVGDRGVGKTTFVHALAAHFLAVKRGKYGKRRSVRIWSTSAARIVAGMAYLGMWQKRVLEIVDELSYEGDYLYLDRLVDVIAPQTDGACIADLLLAAVAAKEISLICECDESELVHARRISPGLLAHMRIIRVAETSPAALVELLALYASRRLAGRSVTAAALRRLVSLLGAFRPDHCFPGKGIKLLEWLATEKERSGLASPRDAAEAFSAYSGLPLELISDEIPAGSDAIAARLARRVVGQESACRTAARALARFKAGLNDPERPVATLFFVGPTGVGKTELAKQLAAYMFGDEKRMTRVDMSEMMTPGSSQRLLAVGSGQESLATRVREEPLSVVLFDEIEKAHPEVFDLLLGVLGEGRMTDARGRLVDFRMTMIVMTSNLGARDARPLGFGADDAPASRRGAVAKHFRPEFVARIDEVVSFRALTLTDMGRIVDIMVARVRRRIGLAQRAIELSMSDDARLLLADLGFDATLGARPLARVIEDFVVTPLATRMASDPSYGRRHVRLIAEGDEIVLRD